MKKRFLKSFTLSKALLVPTCFAGLHLLTTGHVFWGRTGTNGVSWCLQVLGTTFFMVACVLYKPPPAESAQGSSDTSENGNSDLQETKPSLPAAEDI